ncbi:hypothetical protein PV11_01108 [Exophiala sideris]|uniref:Uncharacterized protein n=1 Tax=Exophiala sideris TaxID=1016849 RepID=A0A0D1XBW7_9EURO|nr:hypothetical protein PV11_01108 [Exophiala sideris]
MATSHLGLPPTSYAAPAAFLAWNWAFAYLALSSRTLKQRYGIDHNANPRQDLTKYAEAAIKEGKLTRAQFEQIQRIEAASANSIDGFAFFATSVLFALVTGVPKQSLIGACTTYTIARIVYGAVYVFISHDVYSQLRGISFWVGNASCLYLLWKGGRGGY